MARRPDVEYIRYYTDGSAARQLEPRRPKKRRPLPKAKQQPRRAVYIQPMAVAGILLSVVMLVMMIAGALDLHNAQLQEQAMEAYVLELSSANAAARMEYEGSLDMEAIEKAALAIGMIPESEGKQVTISIPLPEAEEETGLWKKAIVFLEGLFA